MKNTFNTRREKVRGMHPYIVTMGDGSTKYLFESNRNTSLRKVLEIAKQFTDDELLFATTCEYLHKHIFPVDASALSSESYVDANAKRRTFLYYDGYNFWHTEARDRAGGAVRLFRTYERAEIHQGYPDHKIDEQISMPFQGRSFHPIHGMIYWFVWGSLQFDIRGIRSLYGKKEEKKIDTDWGIHPCTRFRIMMAEIVELISKEPFMDVYRRQFLHEAAKAKDAPLPF